MFILFCTSSKFSLVCIEWFDFLQRHFCKYISSEFIFKHVYIWSIRCFVSAISHICHFARAFLQREKKRNNDDRIPYKIFNWYFSMNAYKRCHYERAMTLSYSVLSGYLLQNTHTHTKCISQSMPMPFFPHFIRYLFLHIFAANLEHRLCHFRKKSGPPLAFFTSNHFKTEFHTQPNNKSHQFQHNNEILQNNSDECARRIKWATFSFVPEMRSILPCEVRMNRSPFWMDKFEWQNVCWEISLLHLWKETVFVPFGFSISVEDNLIW